MNFIRRKDTQVKVHGQRIELGEVEYHMKANMHQVQDLAVDVFKNPISNSETMVAFLALESVADQVKKGDESQVILPLSHEFRAEILHLRRTLSVHISAYMMPLIYLPLREMPIGTAGKLDRRRLKQIVAELSELELDIYSLANTTRRQPSTNAESVLIELSSKVLGKSEDAIGVDDSFFQVGGDSIVAMRLVSEAQKIGASLSIADILRHPTLSNMASFLRTGEVLQENEAEDHPFSMVSATDADLDTLLSEASAQCNVEAKQILDIYPCTPLQEGLISLSVRRQGACLSQMVFRVPPTLQIDRFKDVWAAMAAAHPILRTRIINSKCGKSYQVVLAEDITWQTADSLDQYLELDRKVAITHRGPLTRLALTGQSTHERYFVWTAHHTVYDGYSVGLLFDHLTKYYEQQIIPTASPFKRFIGFLETVKEEKSQDFWRSQLEGALTSFPQKLSSHEEFRPDHLERQSISLEARGDLGIQVNDSSRRMRNGRGKTCRFKRYCLRNHSLWSGC